MGTWGSDEISATRVNLQLVSRISIAFPTWDMILKIFMLRLRVGLPSRRNKIRITKNIKKTDILINRYIKELHWLIDIYLGMYLGFLKKVQMNLNYLNQILTYLCISTNRELPHDLELELARDTWAPPRCLSRWTRCTQQRGSQRPQLKRIILLESSSNRLRTNITNLLST